MDNIQILHECKDSRDDHFANRRSHAQDDFIGETDEADILEHLESIESSTSFHATQSMSSVHDCLKHVEETHLFESNIAGQRYDGLLQSAEAEDIIASDSPDLEAEWKQAYDQRRDEWKNRIMNQGL
ncbi:hypothetical protein GLOTRDRAFT_134546 [Gloeophyllum trabeum ATCC 11539]|uniref:Uncharacterized protein n=1 Tax=Gloeophyllum trabeum (strain ATCC 11539 / FP-39264 / Madison 617) TaxID=670483 RepID=S7RBR7_GLOTA|nr:uncharacterized protein GLOTRDRAFT_134546 [Gloeophyllum trabeum ATCC 11539]EPQ49839.1 hypothetical protein GLOTRDRAFT_134546 [Gloeophyllum trabeum ATCC 11539]